MNYYERANNLQNETIENRRIYTYKCRNRARNAKS